MSHRDRGGRGVNGGTAPQVGHQEPQSLPGEPLEAPPSGEERGRRDLDDPSREQVLARRALIVLGIAYLAAQLVVVGTDRAPRWDESVYLSQVMPDMEGLYFEPWHSRGITLLVAPVTSLGGALTGVRLFLMVLAAAATTAAFRLWVPLVGLAAVVAAAVFSFSWLSLLSASEVMPNYWASLGLLATAGLVVRRLHGGPVRDVVFAAVGLGAVTFVRPTEAIVFAAAACAYILVFRRSSWRVFAAMGLGAFVGWLPWLVEMSVRFGGVSNAIREAERGGHFVLAPVGANVVRHLAYTDGGADGILLPGAIWWALVVTVSVAGLVWGATRAARASALFCSLAALVFAVEYLAFVSFLNARFLLPAYAMASVPFGVGVASLLRGRRPLRVGGGLVLASMIPWAIWQAGVANRAADEISTGPVRVGATIRGLTGPTPCSFVSPLAYPKIAVSSRCQGARWRRGKTPTAADLEALHRPGTRLFVVLLKEAPEASPLSELTPTRVHGPDRTWYVYEVPSASG